MNDNVDVARRSEPPGNRELTAPDEKLSRAHHRIGSTVDIVDNDVGYEADIVKAYGGIPEIECLPSQINQVIMNIIVNGAQALTVPRGKITSRAGTRDGRVWVEVPVKQVEAAEHAELQS